MSTPSPPSEHRRAGLLRLARELPLLAGVLLGWLAAWWKGKAFVLDHVPHGYGWFDYLNNAWMIRWRTHVGYNHFREPLHAWMVGHLGEWVGSYPDAAVLIASAGVFLLVLGAGLFGRGLVGPWIGGLCAAAIPWTAHAADMARWSNYYGVGGSFAGVALGLGAVAWRWPHPVWAALTGLFAGLAWGVDPRAMTVAAGAVGLVLLGLSRAGPSWPARLVGLVLLGLGVALGPWSHDALWLTEVLDPPWPQRVEFQKQVIERWISKAHAPAVEAACSGYRNLPTEAVVKGPCGAALAAHNLEIVLPRHLPFGLWPTALGLLLGLLPGREGWRGSLSGVALLSGAAGVTLLCLTMPVPDRYLVTFAAVFTLAAPVGLARLVRTVLPARLGPWATALLALGLGGWAWTADPSSRDASTQLDRSPKRAQEREAIQGVRARLGPDDLYLDCSQLIVAAGLLPRVTQPLPPVLRIASNSECADWIGQPSPSGASRWVSIDRNALLPDQRGKGVRDTHIDVGRLLEQDPDWTEVWSVQDFELWQRSPGG